MVYADIRGDFFETRRQTTVTLTISALDSALEVIF